MARYSAGGKTVQPLIFLELNELCPHLLEKWMASGALPNFKALYDASQIYVTTPDVDDPSNLEPWIQWYSIHTGLSFDQHDVFHLTDGPRAGHTDIWEILRGAGYRVGNCSSMNAKQFAEPGSFYLPDPWCTSEQASPEPLNTFHKFVAANVQEYTNTQSKLGLGDYARFVSFLVTHGLRFETVAAVLKQLGAEKLVDGGEYWRRVALLDSLQFDVFQHYQKSLRPHFSTFFANSVAHLQHAHWREMEPEAFQVKSTAEQQRRYGDAILFGYQQMDRLVGDVVRIADAQNAFVVFATALSQQPFLKYESIGGQQFYRVRDIGSFLDQIGVKYRTVQPTMTHQYQVQFASDSEREDAQGKLAMLSIDGQPVFGFDRVEGASLYFGCTIRTSQPETARMMIGNQDVRFFDTFYHIDATKSGRHHPDGCLWFRSGTHKRHEEKVSILDIFPTILDYFRIDAPAGKYGKPLGRIIRNAFA
ncbi:MAG: hypothetical protein ABL951_02015 [Alphaproteobacteria bacterium]